MNPPKYPLGYVFNYVGGMRMTIMGQRLMIKSTDWEYFLSEHNGVCEVNSFWAFEGLIDEILCRHYGDCVKQENMV